MEHIQPTDFSVFDKIKRLFHFKAVQAMKLAAFDKRIWAATIVFFAATSGTGAQAQVTAASTTTPIRHAYQTASYSESFRQKCSRITNIYLENMARRNSRSSLIKAIEAVVRKKERAALITPVIT